MTNLALRSVAMVLSLLASPIAAFSSDSDAARGAALLERARGVLAAAHDRPFLQTAHLTTLSKATRQQGTYTYASSPSLQREQIVLGDYNETRVRTGTSEKIVRPLDREPFAVSAAIGALRPMPSLRLFPNEHITKVKRTTFAERPADCVEIRRETTARRVCVYEDGTLAGTTSLSGIDYEYSKYSTFDGASYPGEIHAFFNHENVANLKLDPPTTPTPQQLADNVEKPTLTLGSCEGMTPPIAKKKVPPAYPMVAKQKRMEGVVLVYAVVSPEGHPQNLSVVSSLGAELDQASLDAVSQWSFQPAMCGATPVAAETILRVQYSLPH